MRVLIGEAAYDDLGRIHAWIAKDRPRSADSVIDRILESISQLGRFPYMGHVGKAPGTYEWMVTGLPYIVVYEVDTAHGELKIAAVFHGAQHRDG
jgi:toxin ParE1/3/4